VAIREMQISPGGQVATATIACARWGLRTRYIGKLGDDRAARIHRNAFEYAGVEAHVTTVANCSSAQSFILVDERGERTVLWGRDPRLELRSDELQRESVVNSRTLLVDGCDTEAAVTAAQWAREAQIPVVADLDTVYPGIERLLQNVDYVIASQEFPAELVSEADLRRSLPELHCRFGCRMTAATLGIDGVLAWDGKRFHHACAYRVPAVDTTGAGDIFHAAFIYGLLRNWSLQHQLDFSCAAAALNCTASGARGKIADLDEIESLMNMGERYRANF
jgi:sulfofructose kinase